jgi:nitrogen regulatory protein PII
MKRIEAVITPGALEEFKEAATKLGISEFSVTEIHCSGRIVAEGQRRPASGHAYAVDLLPRLKVEFVLFDDDVKATLHTLMELVHPDSITVFKLEQTLSFVKGHLSSSSPDYPVQVEAHDGQQKIGRRFH